MLSASQFLAEGSLEAFNAVIKLYSDALKIKGAQKKSKPGEDTLEQLDNWYQNHLKSDVFDRTPPHLLQEDLVHLMKWKLARGKWRPKLVDLAASNSDACVKNATEKGIKLALSGKVEDAVEAVAKLKGVGPATASAVLAACVPEKCGFFADEVAASIPSLAPIKYTAVEYKILNSELCHCAKRLNDFAIKIEEKENGDGSEQWNPHKVELAVWTLSILRLHKPIFLKNIDFKRFNDDEEEDNRKRRKN